MPDTTLMMKFVVEPISKLLPIRIKSSKKVAELADTLAKNDFVRSKVIHGVTKFGASILPLSVLGAAVLYKKNELPYAMNVLRKEFSAEMEGLKTEISEEMEGLRTEIKEVREENKKQWEVEHEKQREQVGLFLRIQDNMKEDLKEIIINEVPGIVRKVLREEGASEGKEGI